MFPMCPLTQTDVKQNDDSRKYSHDINRIEQNTFSKKEHISIYAEIF